MCKGDLVRWIGFPGACPEGVKATGPSVPGIVIKVYNSPGSSYERVDVLWGDGKKGDLLYPRTLEVISE